MKNLIMHFICFGLLTTVAMGQDINHGTYNSVNIDSLLKSTISVPEQGYAITNVKFIAEYNGASGKLGGTSRDKFLQLQWNHPELKFKFGPSSTSIKIDKSILYTALGPDKALWEKVSSLGGQSGQKIVVYAQVIVGNFERYGLSRELLIMDISKVSK